MNQVVKSCGVNSQGVGRNARRPYVAPAMEVVKAAGKPVMFTTSPGVSEEPINPNGPFDSKKSDFNIEFRDMWEE